MPRRGPLYRASQVTVHKLQSLSHCKWPRGEKPQPLVEFTTPTDKLAEKSGSRTHQGRLTPLTGFEVRAPHRGAFLFRP
jgi:hypothetical protein